MSAIRLHRMPLWLALLAALPVQAQNVDEVSISRSAERHLPVDQPFMQWVHDPEVVESEAGDRLETRQVVTVIPETVKLRNVVPPIHFQSGVADIPASTVDELRVVLESVRHRQNVRLNLIGHADSQRLSPALAAIYGDNEGLSRERAGEVAEFFQRALSLPPEAISYEWRGDADPIASNDTAEGRARNRRVEVEVWYDELEDKLVEEEYVVAESVRRIKVCRVETVCKLRYLEGHARRARVQNLLPPLRYDEDAIEVPPRFVELVSRNLDNLADKQNVVVKFVGFTDDKPLTGRNERIYGTHLGLSKARAHRVALAVQDMLDLPSRAVESDGRGTARPLAGNDTAQGRALNRRVEVEFWYDDPLQELPDEPQLCPGDPGAETVTRVYEPPWGVIAPLDLVQGQPVIPAGYLETLERALADIADKGKPRLRFVGYTGNERLDRRTAALYGDDIGLSAARARRTMEAVAEALALTPEQAEFEGRGYLHSDDVVNAGFVQGESSHVAVQAVYDELAVLDDLEGLDVAPITRELRPKNPFALNLMRITVDGEPIDDPNRSSADVQRCTDVAMQSADIRFRFDNLSSSPRLAVTARPKAVPVRTVDASTLMAEPVRFWMYSNYGFFIERSEIRLFEAGQSSESTPLAVLEVDEDGLSEWQPELEAFHGPVRELRYLVRAYGADGTFDETTLQPLWLMYENPPTDTAAADDAVDSVESAGDPEAVEASVRDLEIAPTEPSDHAPGRRSTAYGENILAVQNISLSSGTVHVQGSGMPPNRTVWVGGTAVPVDENGNFVTEQILPNGTHTVEVAVLDEWGNGELYLRDLEFERDDWFYVGMADITLSHNKTNGPMDLLTGQNARYDYQSNADGRLAFFVNGKFGDKWKLTASADTREEPIGNLFSNFLSKSPDSLFRRIDPEHHYPTFGDDGTVTEAAPTLGKFYAKLNRGDNYGLWGNFKVGYMGNELARVDRGLYGANAHLQSAATTSFGEQRYAIDAFGAEPGTVSSREEFRGTGGSLYFLKHRDILVGSERVRVEIRDKASGIVTGVVGLTASVDYDVDYLQGTVLLSKPLSSTVDDELLVRGGALSGDEAHLVVSYEYTPGFEELDAISTGAQAHYWFNDYVRIGVTGNVNEQGDEDSTLNGADLTVRLSAASWLKLQGAKSEGVVSTSLRSDDGGFGFIGQAPSADPSTEADAYRVDISVGLEDVFDGSRGRVSAYLQELGEGYSAPGLATFTDTTNYGGAVTLPLSERWSVNAKADKRIQDEGIETDAVELDVHYQLTERWDVSTGARRDVRRDNSPLVPLTQETGERTDAIVQVGYDSRARWSAYGFVQDTVSSTGNREDNARMGVGGSHRLSDSFVIESEVSAGDTGPGGRIGTSYVLSEKVSLYLNYALENERTDAALRASRGREGSLVTGMKTRFSDSTSVYVEERYRHGDSMTGLMHAAGLSFAPSEGFNLGLNTDFGTLSDVQTGAETKREAASVRVGYALGRLQLSGGIELRQDDTEQQDASKITRDTWLYRTDAKFQMTPGARLLAKINYADSSSSLGDFYDGGYTEAVLGYAFRPVNHDRLSTLVKYTYFYNVPTTEQVTLQSTAAGFIQKSHVAAMDVSYDLTSRWTIGGKYAHRLGQVSLDREDPEFFDNRANLYIARADWQFRDKWELLLEGRLLELPDIDERRQGALASVSRYVGRNFKVGAGYNFTDFSEDLTDLSFDHRGIFINLTGVL